MTTLVRRPKFEDASRPVTRVNREGFIITVKPPASRKILIELSMDARLRKMGNRWLKRYVEGGY